MKRQTRFDIHCSDRVWRFDTANEQGTSRDELFRGMHLFTSGGVVARACPDRDAWIETILSMLPYGRQPLSIEPEDPSVAATATMVKHKGHNSHGQRQHASAAVAAPALPTSPPIERPVSSYGPPQRNKSLTFEARDKEQDEPIRPPTDEIVLLDAPLDSDTSEVDLNDEIM